MTQIKVMPCSNFSGQDRPCVPQADIDALFEAEPNFYLTVNYINPVINPS